MSKQKKSMEYNRNSDEETKQDMIFELQSLIWMLEGYTTYFEVESIRLDYEIKFDRRKILSSGNDEGLRKIAKGLANFLDDDSVHIPLPEEDVESEDAYNVLFDNTQVDKGMVYGVMKGGGISHNSD